MFNLCLMEGQGHGWKALWEEESAVGKGEGSSVGRLVLVVVPGRFWRLG